MKFPEHEFLDLGFWWTGFVVFEKCDGDWTSPIDLLYPRKVLAPHVQFADLKDVQMTGRRGTFNERVTTLDGLRLEIGPEQGSAGARAQYTQPRLQGEGGQLAKATAKSGIRRGESTNWESRVLWKLTGDILGPGHCPGGPELSGTSRTGTGTTLDSKARSSR